MDAMPPAGVGEAAQPSPAIPGSRLDMPADSDFAAAALADTLAALRARIDDVDSRMLAAITERIEIAQRVGTAKGAGGSANHGAPVHRPGREATLIRALIARYEGPMEPAGIHAVWREVIGASIAVQRPLTIVTADRAAEQAARLHFGASQRYAWAASPIVDVASGQADIALFPVLNADAWKAAAGLLAVRPDCALLWRLPFTVPGGGWIVVGRGVTEESGDDLTVVIAPLDRVPNDPAIETLCSLPDGRAVLSVDGELADVPADAGSADNRPVLQLGRFPAPLVI